METTIKEYRTLQDAYNYLNKKLFNNELGECIITLQRRPKTRGYYHQHKFEKRTGKQYVDEIAMNPDTYKHRNDKDILSTLAHEMAHKWQADKGKNPPSNGYHNKEWATKMEEIGLTPTSTGDADGKRTGQHMTHIIMKDGLFEKVIKEFLDKSKIELQSIPTPRKKQKRKTHLKQNTHVPNAT